MKKRIKQLLCRAIAIAGPHRLPGLAPRLWILTYHRILPPEDPRAASEEPGMIVTPQSLRRQIEWVREFMPIVRLIDWVKAAESGKSLPDKACAITFDDGWLDNYQYAWPILKESGTPATIFVVSHMVGTNERFWPNRLMDLLQRVSVDDLRDSAFDWLRSLVPFELSPDLSPDQRGDLLVAVKRVGESQVRKSIANLEMKFPPPHADPVLVDWKQIKQMVDGGLVDIGSHTCRHYRLSPDLPMEILEQEISISQARIGEELGREVPLFCYPYGEVNSRAEQVVSRSYSAGLSSRPGTNSPGRVRMTSLSRIGLHDDISSTRDDFLARLSGWI